MTIFTIGHSSHDIDRFLGLLEAHQIEVVVDVRSQPYSKHVPHFNKAPLHRVLEERGLEYLFLGKALGGRPQGDEFYDAQGGLLYDRRAQAPDFVAALVDLIAIADEKRVALLCAEENPARCHRHHLLGRTLTARGMEVLHIRADERLEADDQLADSASPQLPLFGTNG